MLDCFKRSMKKSQSKNNNAHAMTTINYLRDGLRQAVMVEGGPGGSIALSEEEYLEIAKEVDVQIYTGASSAALTGMQIIQSKTFNDIVGKRAEERSALQSPRSRGLKSKS